MQDLNRFFINPFLDKNISRDEIVAFTADTLARLNTQNTAGLYDTALATLDAPNLRMSRPCAWPSPPCAASNCLRKQAPARRRPAQSRG